LRKGALLFDESPDQETQMAEAMPGGSGWRPATDRPECSGIYAVQHGGWAGIDRFAVYCADSGIWGKPQADLRLFDATSAQPADNDPGHEAWRELTDNEMLSLSPTAQAWAAGFLPAGAAILPGGGGASPERSYSRRKRWSNLPKPPPATLDTGGPRASQRRLSRS
jgi:hypothetical protein